MAQLGVGEWFGGFEDEDEWLVWLFDYQLRKGALAEYCKAHDVAVPGGCVGNQ